MQITTIVSAFLTNINTFLRENNSSKTENNEEDLLQQIKTSQIEKYIEYGRKLLEIDIPKIIFIEQTIYEEYLKESIYESNQTHFVFINKTDSYLYEYRDKLQKFKIDTTNKTKDTIDYMFVQCNKTEWMRTASELNVYDTTQFVWVDFGLYHMFGDNKTIFTDSIIELNEKSYDKVRIASIWNMHKNVDFSYIYNNVFWFFAGSIFGGNKENICRFADLMKSKCIEIMSTELTICWEVNIWVLIYKEQPDLFDIYHADHNKLILENY
jgi:hypothetical protein